MKFTCFLYKSSKLLVVVVALLYVSIVSIDSTSKRRVMEIFSFPNEGNPTKARQSCSNKARNYRHPPPSEQLCYGVPVAVFLCVSDVPLLRL